MNEIRKPVPQGDLDSQPSKRLPDFDPDLQPGHEVNRRAAEARGLRFDSARVAYVDSGGCPKFDRYGQAL